MPKQVKKTFFTKKKRGRKSVYTPVHKGSAPKVLINYDNKLTPYKVAKKSPISTLQLHQKCLVFI